MLAPNEFKPLDSSSAAFRNRPHFAALDNQEGVANHHIGIILTECPRTLRNRWALSDHELRTKSKTFFRWPVACEQCLVQNANYVWTAFVRITTL